MRHARLQKLQRFRRKMPFYSFLILWLQLRAIEVERFEDKVVVTDESSL